MECDWIIIAKRIGRSSDIKDIEQNSFAGKVNTVEDLVYFLTNQPKIPNC